MKKLKNLLAVLLCVSLLVCLTSCGESEDIEKAKECIDEIYQDTNKLTSLQVELKSCTDLEREAELEREIALYEIYIQSSTSVLMEIYGEGVMIQGESGVGKSEVAIELIKRGHRIIADDAVEIKLTERGTLMASSPALIRHYMELRGIGIIDVRRLFGMGAVKDDQRIDMILKLEPWDDKAFYDRLGLDMATTDEFLGIPIPMVTIPVKPGRNLAVIVEVAAMNNRNRKMGHNAAQELTMRMDEQMNQGM